MRQLWTRLGDRLPEKVQTDSGGEFYNARVQAFFKKHGVNHFSTHGDPHGSVVERWNRTLKTNMFRYFTAHNSFIIIIHFIVVFKKNLSMSTCPTKKKFGIVYTVLKKTSK